MNNKAHVFGGRSRVYCNQLGWNDKGTKRSVFAKASADAAA